MFARLGDWVYRHRYLVLAVWVVIFIVALGQAAQVNRVIKPAEFTIPGSESDRVAQLIGRELGLDEEHTVEVVFRHPDLKASDPAFQDAVEEALRRGARVLPINRVITAYSPGAGGLTSKDGHAVEALVNVALSEPQTEDRVAAYRNAVRIPSFEVLVSGFAPANYDFVVQGKEDLAHQEVVTLPVLAAILLVVFGTLVGVALPLILAVLSISVSTALVFWIGHQISTSTYVINMVTILGLGIAVDYALFMLYRFREELAAHPDVRSAVRNTVATAGHALAISGVMVALAMSTLVAINVSFLTSLGIGGVLVPLVSLAVVLTAFPALLGVLGPWVNRLPVLPARFRLRADGRLWSRLARAIMRRPWVAAATILAVLLALAIPALQLRSSLGGDRNNPPFESVLAFRMLARDFDQGQTPILVAVRSSNPEGVLQPPVLAGMGDLAARLRADREVARVESPTDLLASPAPDPSAVQRLTGRTLNAAHDLAVIRVTPRSEYGSPDNQALIGRIRHRIVPAVPAPPGVTVLTGGGAAPYYEFTTNIYDRFWYVVAVILLFSYLFLFLAFRSVFVPLKAVVMNLLALAASFGLLQLVFQGGLGDSLLGIVPEEGIAPWVPVFLFALLFGLSTDYEVFLLSRIRERFAQTGSNAESVSFGLAKTGVLITSAAAIMVIVFGSFLISRILSFKQMGVALAAAIFIDASLIRVILVPALMTLMGRWNWWAPRFARGLSVAPASKEVA